MQRTSSTGGTIKFVYDGADVVRDLDGSDGIIADYLNGLGFDSKVRMNAGGTISYFVTDHLSSTRSLADVSGNLTSNVTYSSFGNFASGPPPTRYTFAGREIDSDTGLMYYRARWYDTQVGRFVSEDPIEFGGGMNWYAYVDHSPISWIDPFGWAKLFYWSPYRNSKKGHAALMLDDGTYISYWPTCEDEFTWDPQPFMSCAARRPNYDQDVEGEGGRRPEEIPIEDLDETAIKQWWNDGKGHGDFSLWNNCSDIVAEALRIGGLPIPKPIIYTTPDYIKRQVKQKMVERKYPARPLPPGLKRGGCNTCK